MTTLEVHTLQSAPLESQPVLAEAEQTFGAIPNLFGVFAESPAILKAYAALGSILDDSSLFSATELQVVLMTTSFENECGYCMAAHSAIATQQRVPQAVLDSVRNGLPIGDVKLEALRMFTQEVVRKRGVLSAQDIEAPIAVGYTKRHLLEVVLGVGFKTLSNFTARFTATPVDASFQRFAWTPPTPAAHS